MNDTEKLLRECNSGIKMGVSSIERVMPYAKSEKLKKALNSSKDEHAVLGDETHKLLLKYGVETKEPHPVARMMSDMKIRGKMMMNRTDKTIADLMTDGCNMGVKSLNKYMNKYKAADEVSKDIAKRLVNLEEKLTVDIREFL